MSRQSENLVIFLILGILTLPVCMVIIPEITNYIAIGFWILIAIFVLQCCKIKTKNSNRTILLINKLYKTEIVLYDSYKDVLNKLEITNHLFYPEKLNIKYAYEMIQVLDAALILIEANPKWLKSGQWNNHHYILKDLIKQYLKECKKYPDAKIKSREYVTTGLIYYIKRITLTLWDFMINYLN